MPSSAMGGIGRSPGLSWNQISTLLSVSHIFLTTCPAKGICELFHSMGQNLSWKTDQRPLAKMIMIIQHIRPRDRRNSLSLVLTSMNDPGHLPGLITICGGILDQQSPSHPPRWHQSNPPRLLSVHHPDCTAVGGIMSGTFPT